MIYKCLLLKFMPKSQNKTTLKFNQSVVNLLGILVNPAYINIDNLLQQ